MRFPLEGDYLRRLGFFVVYLDVPLGERQRRIIQRDGHWDPAWSSDPTEALVDDIPYHLKLDGTATPEALAERIVREAEAWRARSSQASA
jgi:chloramphenicol 3-O-phosphotransferase